MHKLNINLGARSYPVYITNNYSSLGGCLSDNAAEIGTNGKLVMVTDSNVDKTQAADCVNELRKYGWEVCKFVLEAGERSKTLENVRAIYKFLVDVKAERNSVLMALGGGVVGDIAGFAAATYMRGIPLVQIPTSLLAQADSSIGGKVGVDFEGKKNIIGAFYQPKFVYVNVNSLKTLPRSELKSGLAETLKHAIIADENFFEFLSSNVDKIMGLDEQTLVHIAETNCTIKGGVVEEDERESGLRAILNFGHTIGHAVESASNFTLSHGECVSVGMVGAFKMAQRLNMVNENETARVASTLLKIGLPVKISGIDVYDIYKQMFYDKKVREGKLMFILPRRIGEVIRLAIEDEGLIIGVLREIAGK